MAKILEYKTIARSSHIDLDTAVNDALRHGYLVYGSPYAARDEWCQALIKTEPQEPAPAGAPHPSGV